MGKKSENVNKTAVGVNVPATPSGATNSETDSETLKALEEVNIRLKDRKIKAKLVSARNSYLFVELIKTAADLKKKERFQLD